MTQPIFNYDDHPVDRIYVDWANTLDSSGKDSTEAAKRIANLATINNMAHNLSAIVDLSERSDAIKKYVFYGKEPDGTIWLGPEQIGALDHKLVGPIVERTVDHNMIRTYHAILGLFTEIGELASAYMKYIIDGVEIDWANIAEESGDLCWYMALLARAQGYTSFDEFMLGNKAKLTARYGKTWTQDGALNRDTEIEMQELESAAPVKIDSVTDSKGNTWEKSTEGIYTTGRDVLVIGDEIYDPEEEIEAIDRAIEIMMLRRNKLQGQTTVPAPPAHDYGPLLSNDRKEAILKKYPTLRSIASQLSACMYVTQDLNHRLENNEAFIALRIKAGIEPSDACICTADVTVHHPICPLYGVLK